MDAEVGGRSARGRTAHHVGAFEKAYGRSRRSRDVLHPLNQPAEDGIKFGFREGRGLGPRVYALMNTRWARLGRNSTQNLRLLRRCGGVVHGKTLIDAPQTLVTAWPSWREFADFPSSNERREAFLRLPGNDRSFLCTRGGCQGSKDRDIGLARW